ncbi:hypothetical protein J40TS1_18250 [Paenibacillus montaniterrae]|uniref:non-reducing end alpha-L-arabinofuranosidase n=1 Tax=Paenibacillus montaniterrae TaxID=429341 RepID=A0A919YLQ2_9BACL|nr:alpha-L-arabinofuranosidase C-terminal domain-containing protein [Paenibacillus montaniterrae]GIP16183.1 hypothetical protein J40TS1_18250 [Paenibacillus montaniterrae]
MRLRKNQILIISIVTILLMIGLLFLVFNSKESRTEHTLSGSNTDSTNDATTTSSTMLAEVSFKEDLLLHYSLNQTEGTTIVDESGNGQDGAIVGAASFKDGREGQAIELNGGYIKMPNGIVAEQQAITISTWINPASLPAWSRIFDIGSSMTNYIFFTLNNGSSVQLGLHLGSTVQSLTGVPFTSSNQWQHIAVTIEDKTAIIYINGIEVLKNTNLTITPDQLGATSANYIGKSQYSSDPNYVGKIEDFRIYSRALDEFEVMQVMGEGMEAEEAIAFDKEWLELGVNTLEITNDLELPNKGPLGTSISWTSSDGTYVSDEGKVTRPAADAEDANVTLTATLSKDGQSAAKEFELTIWAEGAVAYEINVDAQPQHEISPTLYGLFYEDINYAADGGLYGELVHNRSFEFNIPLYGWKLEQFGGGEGSIRASTEKPLNDKNHKYVEVTATNAGEGVGISNAGYSGIAVEAGASYQFSIYAKSDDKLQHPLTAELRSKDNSKVYGACSIDGITTQWQKLQCVITANETDYEAQLVVLVHDRATIALDMVSLFPQKVWNNRSNGLRYDLAELLDDMEPGFLRFPGGCIVEGGSLDNYYRWENTIGDIAERETQRNQWANNYYQSFGLGYQEYFQFAEDIGAEPLPVIFVGIESCTSNPDTVPLNELQPYIDSAFNLIEYANGDVTTKWGALRAANGHPEPFNMKYLGIGNELWGAKYYERYKMFYDAIKEKHPEIKLIFSSGAFPNDGAYSDAYNWLAKHNNPADLVDEHMYQSPSWMLDNVSRYDDFSRSGPKVFVGEYASHGVGKRNNMESAITEAVFMTGLERNADIVEMAAYAPLFSRQPASFTQWTPDMIWFDQHRIVKTPNYYVQKLFMNHTGNKTLPLQAKKRSESDNDITGSIFLGSWATQIEYDNIKVTSEDGSVLYANDFSDSAASADFIAYNDAGSSWKIEDGLLKQTSNREDTRFMLGSGQSWSNYTLELEATKKSGNEGFLIGFAAKDADNYYWLNLGGWGNTRTVIEKAVNGSRGIVSGVSDQSIASNKTYKIKIIVEGSRIRCYLDDELLFDLNESKATGPLYSSASLDEKTGDIILKVVNSSSNKQYSKVNVNGAAFITSDATVFEMSSPSLTDENSFDDPNNIEPVQKQVSNLGESFHYEFPAHSVTILRLRTEAGPAITAVDDIQLTTSVGKAPSLPAKIVVTKSDGTTESVAVAWKKVDSAQYAKPGMFRVKGELTDTYLKAYAEVTVQE